MGELGYIKFLLRGVNSHLLYRTLLVPALYVVGVVAVGCYQTDRSNENREAHSDGSALPDAAADIGSRIDNGENIDAAPNPRNGNDSAIDQPPGLDTATPDHIIDASANLQNGNDSAIDQSPQQDAAPPDVIEITNRCGILRSWRSNDNVRSPAAIRGRDGFMVIKKSLKTPDVSPGMKATTIKFFLIECHGREPVGIY